MKILAVDDEKSIRMLVADIMMRAGHECVCCNGGAPSLEAFATEKPDLIVLDVMMPVVDGFEVCRRVREVDPDVPVLFLSAKGDIVDKRIGFSFGADDYLVKPFNEEELLMRAEALLRRARRAREHASIDAGTDTGSTGSATAPVDRFCVGEFEFNLVRHQVKKAGEVVALTPKEFQLLHYLATQAGKAVSRDELVENVWGKEYLGDQVSLAVYIRKLRGKIESVPAKPHHLVTVWGIGYTFEA